MVDTSPPRQRPYRVGSLGNFLPHSEDTMSTRGQRLPSLIRDRSVSSLKDMRAQIVQRRHSAHNDTEDEQDIERGLDEEAEEGRGGRLRPKRKMSDGSQILATPQLRSMRLIGNNNPRYQWSALSTAITTNAR